MKQIKLYLFVIVTLFLSCPLFYAQNIEQKITEVLEHSKAEKSITPIEDFYKNNENQISNYWKAYIKYRQATLYGNLKNSTQEEKLIKESIDLLESKNNKNAEDWILLALVQNYEIKFASIASAPLKSMKVTDQLEKAEALDRNNPRLFLVKAIQDMYTPAAYGGQKKAESYFNHCINLFSKADNTIAWGYEDAYIYLISFYFNKKEMEKAKLAFYRGLALFPNSSWFIRNKEKFN